MSGIWNRASILRLVLCAVAPGCCLGTTRNGSADRVDAAGRDRERWTRIEQVGRYSLLGDVLDARNLSGLAFASDRFGLIGADETRAVQVVEVSRQGGTLRVLDTIPLVRSGSEIDIEAIAAEANTYYITGSHGASKKKGEHQDNRYGIFRLKVDPATGRPNGPPAAFLKVASLADVLRADPVLGEHFGKPLQQKGINIEGLAVRNGQLFVGFRNPTLDGNALVMEIRADDVFGGKSRPPYTLHRLPLGPGLGIREIVAAKSCFLIIAGNAGSEPSKKYGAAEDYEKDRDFFLFSWEGRGPAVHKIGALPKTEGKAEAMAILEETPDGVTVLVLFDGPEGGRPTAYRIS
jgi:Protein of unknown function (DUF3616)